MSKSDAWKSERPFDFLSSRQSVVFQDSVTTLSKILKVAVQGRRLPKDWSVEKKTLNMPTIEVLPNTSASSGQRSGNSSWYYSTAAPSQSVSAMPTAAELRTRKAKQTKDASHVESLSKKDIAAQKRIVELEKVNWRDVVIKIPEKKGIFFLS